MTQDSVTKERILEVLADVVDPELGDNLVNLGMVRGVEIDGGHVVAKIALTIAACPLRSQIETDVRRRLESLAGVETVTVEMAAMTKEQRSSLMDRARAKAQESALATDIPSRTRIIALSSGKGGVGKSSITANLAASLAATGLTVGVLDADIAGFSLPHMLGAESKITARSNKIVPLDIPMGAGKLRVVSMGLIEGSGETEAVMLRGLMLNRALQHFLEDVQWADIDYLLIDMPPGTGDIQMGLARMLPRADVLVVTTPPLAAQQVASRVVDMSRRGHLRIAGVVENMSYFSCDHGQRYPLFGSGGGMRLSGQAGVPLLAQLPMAPDVSHFGDLGQPFAIHQQDSEMKQAFQQLAETVRQQLPPFDDMGGCAGRLVEAMAAAAAQDANEA